MLLVDVGNNIMSIMFVCFGFYDNMQELLWMGYWATDIYLGSFPEEFDTPKANLSEPHIMDFVSEFWTDVLIVFLKAVGKCEFKRHVSYISSN